MDYQIFTLPNGIRLIHKPSESPVSHACIVINAGSRDEAAGKDGLAHFIEHLLFKKTEKRSTGQILNYIEAVGGDLNAYTTKEYTCIHASFLNPYLSRALDLFEDLIFHSVFPEKEIEKEKGVVLDEIASYQDQPEEAIQDDFEDMIFEGNALGRNILGTQSSVQDLQRLDIIEFLESEYSTERITIGVSGNYESRKIEALFRKYFEAIPFRAARTKRRAPQLVTCQREQEKPITQTHCILGTQAYSMHDSNKIGLMLLNNVLGGSGMASLLNLSIRERYGIAYTIESNYSPLSDTGIFSIYFGTDEEKYAKALGLVKKQLKKICEEGISPQALDKAKKKFNGLIALGEDNRMSLIIAMAKSLLDYDRIDSLEEVFAKVNAVSETQIKSIANEIFDPERLSLLLFKPDNETAD